MDVSPLPSLHIDAMTSYDPIREWCNTNDSFGMKNGKEVRRFRMWHSHNVVLFETMLRLYLKYEEVLD